MILKSKIVVNSVISMIIADLPELLLATDNIKLVEVKKGKHKLLRQRNTVFVSNAKFKNTPEGIRYYSCEIYFNVGHENPDRLEDMVNDFTDCLCQCFEDNPTLNDEVLDSNIGDGYFFVDESNLNTAIGKLELEVTI